MKLLKSKTFWAAIVQWVIAIVTWITGEISLEVLIGDTVGMLMLIFYRSSIDQNLRSLLNGFFSKVNFLKDGVFWTVLIGILGSVVTWLTGVISIQEMLLAITTALIGFFLRSSQVPETPPAG